MSTIDTIRNDARAAVSANLSGLIQDMLSRGEDPTDYAVWRPAKQAFLRSLIIEAKLELAKPPRSPISQP